MDNINNTNNSVYRNAPKNISNYTNPIPANTVPANTAYWARNPVAEPPEVLDFREKIGRKLGLASLIYALFSTICLYNTLSGVTMPFFGIATLIYMIYGLKQYDLQIKRTSLFYATVIMALAISDFLTGNYVFHFFNNVGIILMIFIFLLHNVYNDSRWNFSKTFCSICESFFCSIGALDDFGKDMKVVKERRANENLDSVKKNNIKNVIIGLLISIPVVGVLLILLANADIVFNNMLTNYFSFDINFGTIFGVAITFTIIFFASYCIMRFFSKKTMTDYVNDHRELEPVIAITVLSLVSAIYLAFSVVQIVYLFLGGGSLPEGYSYSDYAREGFFQLLAVSIINFIMVLIVKDFFKENRALKVLMTIISLCTYIMIASSFVRIMMYIDAALLTALRIWVLWGLALLSILFVAVIISIYKDDFPLFKYSIIVVSALYIALSFARPDYIIADYNMKYMETIDPGIAAQNYEYMTGLSTDAAPIISQYKEKWADDYFENNQYTFNQYTSWRQFNLSRYTAKVLSETR